MAPGAVSSMTPASADAPNSTSRRGNAATPRSLLRPGSIRCTTTTGSRNDGLAGHVDEHDVGHEGVVQLPERVASARQDAQGFGSGERDRRDAGAGDRQCLRRRRRADLNRFDHTVARDDQAGTRPEGIGEPAGDGRHGPRSISRRRRGCGGEVVQVERVDAAVTPHLLGFGGDAQGGRNAARPRRDAAPANRGRPVPKTRRR